MAAEYDYALSGQVFAVRGLCARARAELKKTIRKVDIGRVGDLYVVDVAIDDRDRCKPVTDDQPAIVRDLDGLVVCGALVGRPKQARAKGLRCLPEAKLRSIGDMGNRSRRSAFDDRIRRRDGGIDGIVAVQGIQAPLNSCRVEQRAHDVVDENLRFVVKYGPDAQIE